MRSILILIAVLATSSAIASDFIRADSAIPIFRVDHGAQGTGNWKGKRDKHEKPKPQNEKKKKSGNWLHLKKKK